MIESVQMGLGIGVVCSLLIFCAALFGAILCFRLSLLAARGRKLDGFFIEGPISAFVMGVIWLVVVLIAFWFAYAFYYDFVHYVPKGGV